MVALGSKLQEKTSVQPAQLVNSQEPTSVADAG